MTDGGQTNRSACRPRCCPDTRSFRRTVRMLPVLLLLVLHPGCADSSPTTRPTAADRALSDPWGYGPKAGVPDKGPKKDDSSFDREGFKKDLNNVLNP